MMEPCPDPAAPSAELVVDPDRRRQGLGGLLLDHVLQRWPGVRLWSHGDLQDARRLYTSRQLSVVRELWQMSRPLAGEWADLPDHDVELPEGLAVRPFRVGHDEQAWLATYQPSQFPPFAVTTDMVLLTVRHGTFSVLLVERASHPFRGALSLPGGFVAPDEDLDTAAVRRLERETGVRRDVVPDGATGWHTIEVTAE